VNARRCNVWWRARNCAWHSEKSLNCARTHALYNYCCTRVTTCVASRARRVRRVNLRYISLLDSVHSMWSTCCSSNVTLTSMCTMPAAKGDSRFVLCARAHVVCNVVWHFVGMVVMLTKCVCHIWTVCVCVCVCVWKLLSLTEARATCAHAWSLFALCTMWNKITCST